MSTAPIVADAVAGAIAELEQCQYRLSSTALGDGGSIVTVHDLVFGPLWQPERGDLIFEIAYNYPYAAIYPYYTTPALCRRDGIRQTALRVVDWRGGQYTQISLRARRWNPQIDTAVGAVTQVQRWFTCPN